jgi:predicted ATP-dependent endonuclease of OLD family
MTVYLEGLNLHNYRNFKELKLAFNNNIVVILGENGSGKTNILESISLLLFKEGFITSTYHSDTFDGCENWRKDEYLRKIKERIFVNENRNVLTKFIGLKHSLKVGNCEIGTKMFAQRHNLDVNNGYRLDYLLSLEPNNIFVNKLIKSLHY